MKKHLIMLTVAALLLSAAVANADVLFGECNPKDGARISTSWNSVVAYSRNGKYELDFGGKLNGNEITVYVEGMTYAKVRVDGATKLHIDARKK